MLLLQMAAVWAAGGIFLAGLGIFLWLLRKDIPLHKISFGDASVESTNPRDLQKLVDLVQKYNAGIPNDPA
jgi:hypothetical protein